MLLWISIALLLDAAGALWFERSILQALPGWNIRALALAEAVLAVLLALLHVL